MEVVPCPLPPPESSHPMLPLPRGLGSGSPESDSGPGRMCRAGLWQKCTAVARWRRPPKSRPHCATEYNKKQIISQNQCCCSRGMHTCTHSRPTSLKDLRRKHQSVGSFKVWKLQFFWLHKNSCQSTEITNQKAKDFNIFIHVYVCVYIYMNQKNIYKSNSGFALKGRPKVGKLWPV